MIRWPLNPNHFLNQFCISDDSLGIANTGYYDDEDENKSSAKNNIDQEQKIKREASKTDADLPSGKISILKISADICL